MITEIENKKQKIHEKHRNWFSGGMNYAGNKEGDFGID